MPLLDTHEITVTLYFIQKYIFCNTKLTNYKSVIYQIENRRRKSYIFDALGTTYILLFSCVCIIWKVRKNLRGCFHK